jgi:hypothetical protein
MLQKQRCAGVSLKNVRWAEGKSGRITNRLLYNLSNEIANIQLIVGLSEK